MSDIVERLRSKAEHEAHEEASRAMSEAADEIERLRGKLAFVEAQIKNDCDVDMEPCTPADYCLCAQNAAEALNIHKQET